MTAASKITTIVFLLITTASFPLRASSLIGPIRGTGVTKEDSIAVGNRLGQWVEGTYAATGEPVTAKINATVRHLSDERYSVDAVLDYTINDLRTICRIPAVVMPMQAELTREGLLHEFKGEGMAGECHVAADLQANGNLTVHVDHCEKFCVGASGEAYEAYRSEEVREKYEQAMDEMKRKEANDLRNQLDQKVSPLSR